jgi:hypothetical protein
MLTVDELKFFDEVKKAARKVSLDYSFSQSARNELADLYEQWLSIMKKHNPKYDEVIFCALPNVAVKRKDIPRLIREGSKDVEAFIRILAR